jgi:hypothetical protein
VLGGRNHGRAKTEPFESGVVSLGSAHLRISAKFYLVAMFFVIFDLEAVFVYAWAVSVRKAAGAALSKRRFYRRAAGRTDLYLATRRTRLGADPKSIDAYRWLRHPQPADVTGRLSGREKLRAPTCSTR